MLYALALMLEFTYITAIHTYTLGVVLGSYIKDVNWSHVMRVINEHRVSINKQFVYAY